MTFVNWLEFFIGILKLAITPILWTMGRSAFGLRGRNLAWVNPNPNIHSILWGHSVEFAHTRMVLDWLIFNKLKLGD